MKRKLILLFLVVSCMLCLAGCGKASVTSELRFHSDGSGSRTVNVTVRSEDARHIEGGFGRIDTLLQQQAPQGVTVRRSDLENGDSVYQFTFFFDNIDQYNQMVKQITGKEHNATWYTNASVFLSNIEFREEDCTEELMQWAVDALKENLGGWASRNLSYELQKNEVYYNDKLQFSGTGDPYFVVAISPKVERASIYTTYAFDGDITKKIVLQFEKGGLDRINLTDAKALLTKYSNHYTFDRANDVIIFTLEKEEVANFLATVDPTYTPINNTFTVGKNPFQEKYEIKMDYNLKAFFSLFDMTKAPYIYDYVKVPVVMNDAEVSYTNSMGNVKVEDGFDYAGGYRFDQQYTASFVADQRLNLKENNVAYTVAKDLSVKREIVITYDKNGCQVSKEEIENYYKDYPDSVKVGENEKEIKVTFLRAIKHGQKKEGQDSLWSYRSGRGIKYAYYRIEDSLDLTKYLARIDGYEWKPENMRYSYTIKVDKNASVSELQVGNLNLSGDKELETAAKGNHYELTGMLEGTEKLSLMISGKQMYALFYLVMLLMVFLVIVAGLIAMLYYLKKKNRIETKDYDDLNQL